MARTTSGRAGPGYTEEPAYASDTQYADEAQYADEPQYAGEVQYADEPQYAGEVQYADEPQYAGEVQYASEPRHAVQQQEDPADWYIDENDGYSERSRSRYDTRTDEWMDQPVGFWLFGYHKRAWFARILLGMWVITPLILISRSVITDNANTIAGSEADTMGTGTMLALMSTLLVTPMMVLTRWRWIFPLRSWWGKMMGVIALSDFTLATIFTAFAGGVIGRIAGHSFLLVGLIMVSMIIPLLLTANKFAQRKLGRYWKQLHKLTYVVWGLLFVHLALLEGLGFQQGTNGSGHPIDGDPVFHNRFYQLLYCSLLLFALRLPPVKRWVARQQAAGRGWVPWAVFAPLLVLFVLGFSFMWNEEIFKGVHAFTLHPSNE
jgi:DMSO/TMAO reductase YedYZ heme-binding membrane subunit